MFKKSMIGSVICIGIVSVQNNSTFFYWYVTTCLIFARASQTNSLQPETALEPEFYQADLKHKMDEIKGFVKLRSPFWQNARKRTMIVKQRSVLFVQVTPSGGQYQLQEN